MQKREAARAGSSGGTPAKRGRPFGSTASAAAAAAAAAQGASSAAASGAADVTPVASLGDPCLHVFSTLADQNNKRIVLALQSGIESELTWALNALTVLSFKEKDDMRREATRFAKVPGLLDAVLRVVDDWHSWQLLKDHKKYAMSGTPGSIHTISSYRTGGDSRSMSDDSIDLEGSLRQLPMTWFDEDDLFGIDGEARVQNLQFAVAASNIIRNFSFMPENETAMVQSRHCLESIFNCLENYKTVDEEIVTNMIEAAVNLAPVMDLRIFSSSQTSVHKINEKHAVNAIVTMLGSSIRAWHCAAAELVGRMIVIPDNEPFFLPAVPEIYKKLVDLMNGPALDSQAAAVGALYSMSEVNADCRLQLAAQRWAIDRLIKIVKAPHPVPDICRKAAMVLESLISEPRNRPLFLAYETVFAEILMTDSRCSDTLARLLYELTARPSSKVLATQAVWGNPS